MFSWRRLGAPKEDSEGAAAALETARSAGAISLRPSVLSVWQSWTRSHFAFGQLRAWAVAAIQIHDSLGSLSFTNVGACRFAYLSARKYLRRRVCAFLSMQVSERIFSNACNGLCLFATCLVCLVICLLVRCLSFVHRLYFSHLVVRLGSHLLCFVWFTLLCCVVCCSSVCFQRLVCASLFASASAVFFLILLYFSVSLCLRVLCLVCVPVFG